MARSMARVLVVYCAERAGCVREARPQMTPIDQALADAKARFAYAKGEEAQWYWAEKVVLLQIERGDHADIIQGKPDQAAIEVLVKAMMEGK
jgi:phosphotransferase system HPr-like phosphotransfer protein